MNWPQDPDTDTLSQYLDEYARHTPPLAVGPVLRLGRRIRVRRRAVTGGGLLLGASLAGVIGSAVISAPDRSQAIVQPAAAVPTSNPAITRGKWTAIYATDRFTFAPEFAKNASVHVTRILGKDSGPSESRDLTLNLIRDPESSEIPDSVTKSISPRYVQDQLSGVTVWIAYSKDKTSIQQAYWVSGGQLYSLRTDALNSGRSHTSKDDLAAIIVWASSHS